jgi:hypothetical protein
VAVKFDGGGAVDPLSKHPLSKGVAIATINMQNNFFTIEFLEGRFLLRYLPAPVGNDGTDFLKRTVAFKPVPASLA